MAAAWPWPSGGVLADLLKELARPHEALWLGWWEAWFVERLDRQPPPVFSLPAWIDALPEDALPQARLRKLRTLAAPLPPLRAFRCFLDPVFGSLPLPLDRVGVQAYPREVHVGQQSGQKPPVPAQTLEQVHWSVPVYLPLACSLGSKVRLHLLEPATWSHRPLLQLERTDAATVVQRLVPPAAAAWAEAWSNAARGLGLRQPLSSPFEVGDRGPILPLKLPRAEQHKVEQVWLLAGDGNLRAAAKVVAT